MLFSLSSLLSSLSSTLSSASEEETLRCTSTSIASLALSSRCFASLPRLVRFGGWVECFSASARFLVLFCFFLLVSLLASLLALRLRLADASRRLRASSSS